MYFKFFFATIISIMCGSGFTSEGLEKWEARLETYDLHAVHQSRMRIEKMCMNVGPTNFAYFEVLPGDKFKNTTGERSEVVLGGWQNNDGFQVSGGGGVEYYKISVKLASDWEAPETNERGFQWGTFFQLHGPNEYNTSPSLALHAGNAFYLSLAGGNVNNLVGGRLYFSDGNLNLGKWNEFIIEVRWANDSTGMIRIHRKSLANAEWKEVLNIRGIPTLQYKSGSPAAPHYWKAGFYRSESSFTNSLWLGPIRRSSTFAAVAN
jgi:hypothetical protein